MSALATRAIETSSAAVLQVANLSVEYATRRGAVQVVSETVSHPLQPMTVDPLSGVAVRVTVVSLS